MHKTGYIYVSMPKPPVFAISFMLISVILFSYTLPGDNTDQQLTNDNQVDDGGKYSRVFRNVLRTIGQNDVTIHARVTPQYRNRQTHRQRPMDR